MISRNRMDTRTANPMSLAGRRVLVTGASSGIGRVERLCGDGRWRKVPFKMEDGRVVCDVNIAFYEGVVLRAGER